MSKSKEAWKQARRRIKKHYPKGKRSERFWWRAERIITLMACPGLYRWEAAQKLGIGERALCERLRKYGLAGKPVYVTPEFYAQASALIDELDDMLFNLCFEQATGEKVVRKYQHGPQRPPISDPGLTVKKSRRKKK